MADRTGAPGGVTPPRRDRARVPACIALFLLVCAPSLRAQPIPVDIRIDPSADTLRISPYIYGSNGQSADRPFNITARRLGGNRLTGYNWENNASNMGMDYNQSNANDDYMTWAAGIPAGQSNIPGITLSVFHDTSLAMGCYSLLTLPAGGYVSRDKLGSVSLSQAAPSYRWRQVVMSKGSAFSTAPDTSDPYVYVDEEVNFLVSRYGQASGPRGVKGYEVDNEPALWPSTHPRLHPGATRVAELVGKTVALARAVKSVDPSAEVFGGVSYGFNEIYNLQNAPDWASYSKYGRWASALLAMTRDSSAAAGKRLMDVLDVHWYPDLNLPVTGNAVDSATAAARVQAPRSLWDSTYVENGWIGQWYSPVALIPNLKTAIALNNPGTKLSVSEFNYGAPSHISGGIALADVLGIFGRHGVYFGSYWGSLTGFVGGAYALYRNYDGKGSTFGDLHVRATTNNVANCTVYASLASSKTGEMHIILMNKNFSRSAVAAVTIAGAPLSGTGSAYVLAAPDSAIHASAAPITLANNSFSYTLPPLSAHHIILRTLTGAGLTQSLPHAYALAQNYPNPFNPSTTIRYTLPGRGEVHLDVYTLLGQHLFTLESGIQDAGDHDVVVHAGDLASGVYLYRLRTGAGVLTRSMLLVR
jgi:mannan endo-1,4-beta-mannosidase